MRILLAEDERDMNMLITKILKKEGYSVDSCFDGEEASEYLRGADYDAAILDIMMPKKDGYKVVEELRNRGSEIPVILLTAKDGIQDRVKGLDIGADDYLIKPFDFDELLARIRAMTRRRGAHTSSIIKIGDLEIDTAARSAKKGNRNIELSAREFSILEYLAANKGRVLSREQIESHVWNYEYEGGTNVVDVYISYLRKKIDAAGETKLIHTVWGTGWTLKEG